MARERWNKDAPQGVHKLVNKIAMSEHKIVFERAEVDEELEFVKEYIEEPLARDLVCRIN